MGFVVKKPITMRVDNIRAILLLEDTSLYQHKIQKYVCDRLISDYIEDETARIQFSDQKKTWRIHLQNLSNAPFEFLP